MTIATVISLLLTFLLAQSLRAREFPRMERLTTEHGLSQNMVYRIFQDREGFLWFGTRDGLSRYDGYNFMVFRHDPFDTSSLPWATVMCIAEDTQGNIWLSSHGGLCRMNRRTARFTRIPHGPENGLVLSLQGDRAGNMWIGTSHGLMKYDTKSGGIRYFSADPAAPNKLHHDSVISLYIDKSGTVWAGTPGTYLHRYNPASRVNNGRPYPVLTRLNFDLAQGGGDTPLPDALQIRVTMPGLYDKWDQGGKIGSGPGIIDAPLSKTIVITNSNEYIGGIMLDPNEEYSVELEILYSGEQPPFNVHPWDMSQTEEGGDIIGGIGLYIIVGGVEGLKRIADPRENISTKLNLSAQPNIGAATMTIGFTLPADNNITLAIYDMNGRLVRTLLSESAATAGRHEIVWDGQSDAGVQAASGTYFYRLSTKEGVAEQQVKIVR